MSEHYLAVRPDAGEFNTYYQTYTRLVPDGNLLTTLGKQHEMTQQTLRSLTDAQALVRPADDEWSVKQVLGHVLDTERLFAFRMMWFARGDTIDLPGMEPNPWVENARFDELPLADLLAEFAALRQATQYLISGLNEAMWLRGGIASNNPVTVRALGWIIAGHELHHLDSLREKYLPR